MEPKDPTEKSISRCGHDCSCSRNIFEIKSGTQFQKAISGVPLGGIGCGTIELRPDSRLHDWQIFNNAPWSGAQGSENLESSVIQPWESFFLLRTQENGKKPSLRLLGRPDQREIIEWYELPELRFVESIKYRGEFPFIRLDYEDQDLPCGVSLNAFSPFIPRDVKNSSLPVIFLEFSVRNIRPSAIDCSIAVGIPNEIGFRGPRELKNQFINLESRKFPLANAIIMNGVNIPSAHPTAGGNMILFKPDPLGAYELGYLPGDPAHPHSHPENPLANWRETGKFSIEDQAPKIHKRKPQLDKTIMEDLERMSMMYLMDGGSHAIIEQHLLGTNQEFQELAKDNLIWVREPLKRWLKVLEIYAERQNLPIYEKYHQWMGSNQNYVNNSELCVEWLQAHLTAPQWNQKIIELTPPIIGILSADVHLEPLEEKTVLFGLAWFFPNHIPPGRNEILGHMYENWFSDSPAIAKYALEHYDMLRSRSHSFREALFRSSLDPWLLSAINAQFSTIVKSSFYTKKGQFGIWEGLGCCGLQTLDVSYYGSFPIALFFPELERSQMALTAQFQLRPGLPSYHQYFIAFPQNQILFEKMISKDPSILSNKEVLIHTYEEISKLTGQSATGRIPHFFPGTFSSVDAYHMVDLMPKFALLVYRDYLFTGDLSYLKSLWPNVKSAIEHCRMMAKSLGGEFQYIGGMHLPYHYVRGETATPISSQTYDGWHFKGYSSYVSGIWIASLLAVEKMAILIGEYAYGEEITIYRKIAQENMDKLLWNGKYYSLWHDPHRMHAGQVNRDEYCMADQLNGQWYARLLGLSDILPRNRIVEACRAIISLNRQRDRGLINGFFPDFQKTPEKVPKLNPQAETPWTGIEYTVAAMLVQEGFITEALEIVKDVFDRYEVVGMRWNHVECGQHYYRAMVIWEFLMEIEGFRWDANDGGQLWFSPKIQAGDFCSVFVVPQAWGILRQKRQNNHQINSIAVVEGVLKVQKLNLNTAFIPTKIQVHVGNTEITGELQQISHNLSYCFHNLISISSEKIMEIDII